MSNDRREALAEIFGRRVEEINHNRARAEAEKDRQARIDQTGIAAIEAAFTRAATRDIEDTNV